MTWFETSDWSPWESYVEGSAQSTAVARSGPLELRVQQIVYTPEIQLYLALRNNSQGTVTLLADDDATDPAAAVPKGAPPPLPYYLEDGAGGLYAWSGRGAWTYSEEDGTMADGKVAPGGRAQFMLAFPAVPDDVRELTLIMNDVRADDGQSYDLRVPVPLPGTDAAS
jgi:hypothetical protein